MQTGNIVDGSNGSVSNDEYHHYKVVRTVQVLLLFMKKGFNSLCMRKKVDFCSLVALCFSWYRKTSSLCRKWGWTPTDFQSLGLD